MLLFQTFFCQLIILTLLITTIVYMGTSGVLTELKSGYLAYVQTGVMTFTIIFNYWMAFWSAQFIVGVQYMVISGAVAKWYFAK